MKPSLLFGLVLCSPLAMGADELLPDQNAPLIPAYKGSMHVQTEADRAKDARCKELSRKIESLQGRPLRKAAAVEEYNAECRGERAGMGGGLQE